MHTGTDFDKIGSVAKKIKTFKITTINVKITVSLHNTYCGWSGK